MGRTHRIIARASGQLAADGAWQPGSLSHHSRDPAFAREIRLGLPLYRRSRSPGGSTAGRPTEVYKPNDAQIAFRLARFVENVRSLSIDAATARDRQGSGAARSLAVTLGLAHDFEHRILADWKRDMLKEMRIPHSPLRRLADTLADVRKSASLQAAALAAFAKDAEPDSTHPSLKERLAALGADGVPSLPALGVPAFESLLPETVRNELPLK